MKLRLSVSCVSFAVVLLACAGPDSKPQEQPPSKLEATLARARSALGWDILAQRGGVVEVLGHTRWLGLDTRHTLRFDGGGRFVESLEGELRQSSGFDGARRWSRDWNDTPRELCLGDATNAELEELFKTGRWCLATERVKFEMAESASAERIALAFRHVDGIQYGVLELDARTFRPAALRFGTDGERNQWSFSDWRVVDGFAYAGAIETRDQGMQRNYGLDSVRVLASAEDEWFAARLAAPRDTRFDESIAPQLEVKRVKSGHLLVHPRIDGVDRGWFIFDSGAGTNCISKGVTDGLAGPIGEILATGVGGSNATHLWRARELSIGPVRVADPVFIELDLSFLEQHFGVPVGGILGYELLSRCVAQVDMAQSRIALHDPARFTAPANTAWSKAWIYGRRPCVDASFEGREGVFLIDTGAASDTVTLHYQVVADLKLLEGRDTHESKSGGVGGFVATRDGVLDRFELGGRVFEALPASFAVEDKGALANDYVWGNIGGKLLEPFELIFDYPGERVGFVERSR